MRSAARSALLVSASLVSVSCDRSAIDPSQSLVGAKSLPSESELSRETIQINRGYGNITITFLSYELLPDDTLKITLSARDRKTVIGEDVFRLSPAVADKARRLLWRVRPQELKRIDDGGLDWETRPLSCFRRGPHDFGDLTIVFIAQGPEPGVDDEGWASSNCRFQAAAEARQRFAPERLSSA